MLKRQDLIKFGPIGVAVILLGLAGWMVMTRPSPQDAEGYHAQLASLAQHSPLDFEGWKGRDEPLPESAVELLKPNAVLSRQYVRESTGDVATFLLVQCRDTRDLAGHYPRNCYPRSGYTMLAAEPTKWKLGDREVTGTSYRFSIGPPGSERRMRVSSLLLLPDGRVVPDMESVREAAANYQLRVFGAGQLQVITPDHLTAQKRREIVESLLAAHQPLIEATLRGVVASSTPSL